MIFSAAYSGQKIVELPISYKERRYGTTQISRFKDGYKLLIYLFFHLEFSILQGKMNFLHDLEFKIYFF